MSADARPVRGGQPYTVRPYEPGDRADVIALYERVVGREGDPWFRWKYENNPYVDHVPIVVAVRGGDVVAATPCFAVELRAGRGRYLALQPADVLIHPDHRDSGLEELTSERLVDRYAERDADLLFSFPDRQAVGDALDHGWERVTDVTTYYRIQRPESFLETAGGIVDRTVRRAAAPLTRAYLRGRDTLTTAPSGLSISRLDGVESDALVAAYRAQRPKGFHALRDSRYYAWRFDNPIWGYETYVASMDGTVVAALVVGTTRDRGRRIVSITDLVPLAGNERRVRVFGALLDRVIDDHRDAALVSVRGDALPRDLLASRGFLADDRLPLASATTRTTLAVRPLGDRRTIGGFDPGDAGNWRVSFSEQSTR